MHTSNSSSLYHTPSHKQLQLFISYTITQATPALYIIHCHMHKQLQLSISYTLTQATPPLYIIPKGTMHYFITNFSSRFNQLQLSVWCMQGRLPGSSCMCDAALEPFAKYIDIHVLSTWRVANTEQLIPVIPCSTFYWKNPHPIPPHLQVHGLIIGLFHLLRVSPVDDNFALP